MKLILAAFLSALTLTASAAPHRVHRPRRHRPVKTLEVVRKVSWQTVAAGGVAAGTVIAACKISDGVPSSFRRDKSLAETG